MTPSQYLEQAVVKTVEPVAQRLHWSRVRDEDSSRGALRDYTAGNVCVRISCDRGLLEVQVGPSTDNLRAVSFYKDLIAPPEAGHWNPSVEQACDLIESQWSWFLEHFTEERMAETLRQLDAHARRNA